MSTHTGEFREAVDHLPPGGRLVFHNVHWDDYEQLLESLTDRPGVRVNYDAGRLEIMSPLAEHEAYKDSLYSMVRVFSEVRGLELETRGSTTWKRRKIGKGSEPDTCFYVANASRIIGKRTIDLETDPPPDVVVEIDTTNVSLRKFSIYAAFGVPEIWRYDGKHATMYALKALSYGEIPESVSLPGITTEMITSFLADAKLRGQTKALAAFRKHLKSQTRC